MASRPPYRLTLTTTQTARLKLKQTPLVSRWADADAFAVELVGEPIVFQTTKLTISGY
jgi:hypothetical protein